MDENAFKYRGEEKRGQRRDQRERKTAKNVENRREKGKEKMQKIFEEEHEPGLIVRLTW